MDYIQLGLRIWTIFEYNISMKKDLKKIIKILEKKKETITMAESCTGGRVASAFTSIPGVSSVFMGSLVTYANEIKEKWLGVSADTLDKHGAVSSQCVEEMLTGAIKMTESNHSIAVSGIAGPSGGTLEKPVGTVYIGVNINSTKTIEKYHFKGDREEIQHEATRTAIKLFGKKIKES